MYEIDKLDFLCSGKSFTFFYQIHISGSFTCLDLIVIFEHFFYPVVPFV